MKNLIVTSMTIADVVEFFEDNNIDFPALRHREGLRATMTLVGNTGAAMINLFDDEKNVAYTVDPAEKRYCRFKNGKWSRWETAEPVFCRNI